MRPWRIRCSSVRVVSSCVLAATWFFLTKPLALSCTAPRWHCAGTSCKKWHCAGASCNCAQNKKPFSANHFPKQISPAVAKQGRRADRRHGVLRATSWELQPRTLRAFGICDAQEVWHKAIPAVAATGHPADLVKRDNCPQWKLSKHMSGHYILLTYAPFHQTQCSYRLQPRTSTCPDLVQCHSGVPHTSTCTHLGHCLESTGQRAVQTNSFIGLAHSNLRATIHDYFLSFWRTMRTASCPNCPERTCCPIQQNIYLHARVV